MKKNYGVSEDTENVETDPLLKNFRLLSEIVAEYQQQEEEETNTPGIDPIELWFENDKRYLQLTLVAQVFLVISASPTSIEQWK